MPTPYTVTGLECCFCTNASATLLLPGQHTYLHHVHPEERQVEEECGVVHQVLIHLKGPHVVAVKAVAPPVRCTAEVSSALLR